MTKRILVGRLEPGTGYITLSHDRMRELKDVAEGGFLPLMRRGLKGPQYDVMSEEDLESNSVTISWIDGQYNKENN